MIQCCVCGGNCDPSDLVSGICDECRERQKNALERKNKTKRLIVVSNSGQMEIFRSGRTAR